MIFRVTAQSLEPTMFTANADFADARVSVENFKVLQIGQDFALEFEADVSLPQQKKLAAKLTPLGTKFDLLFTSPSEAG